MGQNRERFMPERPSVLPADQLAKLAKEYTLGYIRHIEARNLGKRVWRNDQWELRDIVLKDLKAGKHDRKGR